MIRSPHAASYAEYAATLQNRWMNAGWRYNPDRRPCEQCWLMYGYIDHRAHTGHTARPIPEVASL